MTLSLHAQSVEFFEKKIRPVLAEKCYACHNATLATSGLRLDTREGLTRGGTRGAAIVAGHPESSLLLRALSWEDQHLKMPPTGRLSPEQIADFTDWIKTGAPDPRIETAPASSAIDVAAGRRFWAFQPLVRVKPPAVRNPAWPRSDVDSFLLAGLEAKGLAPAAPADRRTLIRRATFDLIGLPPSREEVAAFLADPSPRAFEKVVDRLLASPHYGERWGRHWLDLMRFGETSGHEFDSDKPDAWRYRDYVIRAFNEDVPYDRFLAEHVAGDLVATRRVSAGGTQLESILGTGFFGLHEERNAADDLAEVQAENVDNQIDVLSKSFLGLTVACARCHDHKFDPIPTADYYALAGILHSTRQREMDLSTPATRLEIEAAHRALGAVNEKVRARLAPELRRAAASFHPSGDAWKKALDRAAREPDHVLHPLAVLSQPSEKPFLERLAELRAQLEKAGAPRAGDIEFTDFSRGSYDGWEVEGTAFGAAPTVIVPPNQALAGHRGGAVANSFGHGSDELTGVLVSRSFVVQKRFLHVRIAGSVDKSRRREHGVLRFTIQVAGRPAFVNVDEDGVFAWKTVGIRLQEGQHCHLVIADRARDGHIVVDRVVLSDEGRPPALAPNRRVVAMLANSDLTSLEKLIAAYREMFTAALEAGDAESRWLLAALEPSGKVENLADRPAIAPLVEERAAAAARIPPVAYGLVSTDGAPRDVPIARRGNMHDPGPTTARGFLQVLPAGNAGAFRDGSGRGELARLLSNGENPLVARVMVNRIWKHHFGEGLVRT
ncbi:MAG: DUF1549 domain-containing protein, partial [Bryobacteraceae bacterium]